ncbi:MAG: hypothetical protein ACLFQV_13200 [Vulcanimicrobiota bacterium]
MLINKNVSNVKTTTQVGVNLGNKSIKTGKVAPNYLDKVRSANLKISRAIQSVLKPNIRSTKAKKNENIPQTRFYPANRNNYTSDYSSVSSMYGNPMLMMNSNYGFSNPFSNPFSTMMPGMMNPYMNPFGGMMPGMMPSLYNPCMTTFPNMHAQQNQESQQLPYMSPPQAAGPNYQLQQTLVKLSDPKNQKLMEEGLTRLIADSKAQEEAGKLNPTELSHKDFQYMLNNLKTNQVLDQKMAEYQEQNNVCGMQFVQQQKMALLMRAGLKLNENRNGVPLKDRFKTYIGKSELEEETKNLLTS